MLRITTVDSGLLISQANGGIISEVLIPLQARKTDWEEFAKCLDGALVYAQRGSGLGLDWIRGRTEQSGCLDERELFLFFKENPLLLAALSGLQQSGIKRQKRGKNK